MIVDFERVQMRIHGDASLPTIVYLPGLHGDWTLVSSFRAAVNGRARFIEFAYPCRADWTLDDYARDIMTTLQANAVTTGWILAESFGSQVAWKILERADAGFQPRAFILAGGFVRHPITLGVHGFHTAHRLMPWWFFRVLLLGYSKYARLRHRRARETLASIDEFVKGRTREDRAAIASRYPLIARNDCRAIARSARLPVFALSGFFDPIVPWGFVHAWLRRHCAGFRGSRIIFNADHNVLGTAPHKAADQVIAWIDSCEGAELSR